MKKKGIERKKSRGEKTEKVRERQRRKWKEN